MDCKRNKKEFKIGNINGVTLKYGSTNRTDPRVLYITGKTWVRPTKENDYSDSLNRIKNRMERRILNRLRSLQSLDSKYIFDFSLTPLNMKVGRSKFMTFNLFMRQKKDNVRSLKSVGKIIDTTILPLIDEMIDDFGENYFELNLKKPKNDVK